MTRFPLLRVTVVAAIAALAGATAQAREAYQDEPEMATVAARSMPAGEPSQTSAALATPQHFGEATQWTDSAAGPNQRSAVLAQTRQARQKGLMNDTGEAGASDRVLAQREMFNQQEHDRIVAEYAAADEAQRFAAAEQRRQEIEAASDPMLALLLIDDTDPSATSVTAYTPNDVSQWRASPTDTPQPMLPGEVPSASIAPASSNGLRIETTSSAQARGTLNQGGGEDTMPGATPTPRATYSDGVDIVE